MSNLHNRTQCLTSLAFIQLVVLGMKNHPATLNVQLAASACVFNLTKQDLAAGMPVRLLSTVTQLLLEAMRTFPNHQQVPSCLHCHLSDLCQACYVSHKKQAVKPDTVYLHRKLKEEIFFLWHDATSLQWCIGWEIFFKAQLTTEHCIWVTTNVTVMPLHYYFLVKNLWIV